MPSDLTSSTRATRGSIWKLLAEFSLPNQPGSDRLAGEQALEVLNGLGLSGINRNRLKAAIAEAILHIIEPDHHSTDRPIRIHVVLSEPASSRQENTWGQKLIPAPPTPDSASLPFGQQSQPGWGFFLIHKTENPEQTRSKDGYYLIELFLYRENDLS